MVALFPWKPWPLKLEVQKITFLALIIQIMWLKQNLFKKSSRVLILATCYSNIQSYFEIDLILTMLFNVYFLYRNHDLLGHWQRITQSWTRIKVQCPDFQDLQSTSRQLVPVKKATM